MPACAAARRTPATAGMSGTLVGARGEIEEDIALSSVMRGFMPGIHVLRCLCMQDVDGRDKPGRDEDYCCMCHKNECPARGRAYCLFVTSGRARKRRVPVIPISRARRCLTK